MITSTSVIGLFGSPLRKGYTWIEPSLCVRIVSVTIRVGLPEQIQRFGDHLHEIKQCRQAD